MRVFAASVAASVAASLAALLAVLAGPAAAAADEPGAQIPAPAPKAARPSPGKPRAPVAVDARLGDGTAHVTLRFEAAAEQVEVRVYGVRGLQVSSEERPVTGASFAAGDVKELDVAFTPPAGRAHLGVAVSGRFGGVRRSTVASFAVGTPTEAQKRSAGAVRQVPGGPKIKAVPAQEK